MQETLSAIDAAPDVVIALMLIAAGLTLLIGGPIFYLAGIYRGHYDRRRLFRDNIRLVAACTELAHEVGRLNDELNAAARQTMASVYERVAGRN